MSEKSTNDISLLDLFSNAPNIYGSESFHTSDILKKEVIEKEVQDSNLSNIPAKVQTVPPLYAKDKLMKLMQWDPHHLACLKAKVSATTGLGFMTEDEVLKADQSDELLDAALRANGSKAAEGQDGNDLMKQLLDPARKKSKCDQILDPLCRFSWQDLMTQMNWDLESGDGYVEVKRNGDKIVGLHHIPANLTHPVVDRDTGEYHYCVAPGKETKGSVRHFARFGDKEAFIARMKSYRTDLGDSSGLLAAMLGSNAGVGEDIDPDKISEVIHFRIPGPFSQYLGWADWLPAVPQVDLSKAVTQHKYDFFWNRGVPEFLLFLKGMNLDETKWEQLLDNIKVNQGTLNRRKTTAVRAEEPEADAKVLKLGAENLADTFKDDSETIAIKIVTAHAVPPILANILIPGKMGGNNEVVNALLAFQLMTVGPRQRIIERTLAATLGSDAAGLGLGEDDLRLRRITSLMNMENMDTVSRMRTQLPVAQAEGRDVNDGLKE